MSQEMVAADHHSPKRRCSFFSGPTYEGTLQNVCSNVSKPHNVQNVCSNVNQNKLPSYCQHN